MQRNKTILGLAVVLVLFLGACHNSKIKNPIANVDSKQPDKVLFDRALEAMKANKYDVARLSLQTLINTYPDSEFIARAKLGVADSWYAEGTTTALAQAELEYKDFETFFPNMPEAAEAHLKVANIHFRQMEKADRDYTHAKRAEDEYRSMITMYPDSKLVPEAKARLLEVQEVLAEREFVIGKFYYLRESYPASIARLKTLVDTYPLSSHASESLMLLGGAYEAQKMSIDRSQSTESLKAKIDKELTDRAADMYSQIVRKYPLTENAAGAKERLKALNREVPTPTAEDIAFNKKVQESRGESSRYDKLKQVFRHGPDVASAAHYGDPTMEDPAQTNAPDVLKVMFKTVMDAAASEKPANAQPATLNPPPATGSESTAGATIINPKNVKLGPNGELPASDPIPGTAPVKPTDTNNAPLPPPVQVNDANNPEQNAPAKDASKDPAKTDAASKKDESSSKKKKKGFFHKIIPIGS